MAWASFYEGIWVNLDMYERIRIDVHEGDYFVRGDLKNAKDEEDFHTLSELFDANIHAEICMEKSMENLRG